MYVIYVKKKFDWKAQLEVHLRIHSVEKPHNCDFCQKGFIHKIHLEGHLLIHTEKWLYSCYICAKIFVDKPDLNCHLTSHRNHEKNNVLERKTYQSSY